MLRRPRRFHYRAIVGAGDIHENELSVDAEAVSPAEDVPMTHASDDGSGLPEHLSLFGERPRVRFWQDQMNLISARPARGALARWCGFPVGDVALRAAREGDSIHISRNSRNGLALAIFRRDRLIVAVGDLAGAPVGSPIRVTSAADRRYQVALDDTTTTLGVRHSASIGGYDVYVEYYPVRSNPYAPEPPGCLAIALADDPVVVNSARRSAVLIAQPPDSLLHGELVDGTFLRNRWLVP